MTVKSAKKPTELNVLAAKKLPHRLLSLLRKTKFTVDDIIELENGKPMLFLAVVDDELNLDLRIRMPVKQSIAVVGTISSSIWILVQNWPTIHDALQKIGLP